MNYLQPQRRAFETNTTSDFDLAWHLAARFLQHHSLRQSYNPAELVRQQDDIINELAKPKRGPKGALVAASLRSCRGCTCGSASCLLCRSFADHSLIATCETLLEKAPQSCFVSGTWALGLMNEQRLQRLSLSDLGKAFNNVLTRGGLTAQPWLGRMHLRAKFSDDLQTDVDYQVGISVVTAYADGEEVRARLTQAIIGQDCPLIIGNVSTLARSDAKRRQEVMSALRDAFSSKPAKHLSTEMEAAYGNLAPHLRFVAGCAREAEVRLVLAMIKRPYRELLLKDSAQLFDTFCSFEKAHSN